MHKKKNIIGALSLLFAGAVFGAILVSGFGYVRPSYADVRVGSDDPPIVQVDPAALALNNAFVEVAEKVTPSIVQIRSISSVPNPANNDFFRFFFPFREDVPRERQSGGSGVIISGDGYIMTNNHVVENATQVEVSLFDKRVFQADVVGTDPLTDLAVIKIDAENLPAAHLGNSDNLKVGQWVMAIGNPLALTSTVTAGIVSAVGRSIGIIRDSYGVEDFIQTDAAINPGNSGGALVDLTGSVIGINTAIATSGFSNSYIGYGFAIPINLARSVSKDLIASGKVTRGYIGVRIEAVDANMANAVGLNKPRGVLIQEVMKDGAAAAEDIKAGDIILKVDDREVNQANELQSYVAAKRAGDEIALTLFRDKKEIIRTVTLKAREEDEQNQRVSSSREKDENKDVEIKEKTFEEIGMTVRNMTKDEFDRYKIENGIIITDVKRFGRAENQRLGRGVVITEVDRKEISSVKEFEEMVEDKKGGAVLLKVIYRDGNNISSRFVGLDIPK